MQACAYLSSSSRLAFAGRGCLEFELLGEGVVVISDKDVAKTKFELDALHAEEKAFVKMRFLLMIVRQAGIPGDRIGNRSVCAS